MTYTFTNLTETDVETLLRGLGELQMKHAIEVFIKLQTQAKEQQNAKTEIDLNDAAI